MLLEIDNFEQFRVFFDVIYDVTELIELQLFQDKMVCSILDKSHSRFMSATFKKDFFSLYEIDDVESVTLFAEDVYKIIKSSTKIDNVVLQTNDDYLICRFEGKNGNSRIFEFVLPSDHTTSPQPPSLTLPIKFDLNLIDLKQGLNDLKTIGSTEVQLNVTDEMVSITTGIETTTNYVSNIPTDVEVDSPVSSRFSLEYVAQLLKFDKISKVVEIKTDNNFPLIYSFKDEIMGVEINGMIAPRVEVE